MTLRLLVGGRLMLGTLLLATPERILSVVSRRRAGAGERAAARLLGIRNLVEGSAVARNPSRRFLLAGAAVDATHSLSMVALAAVRPGHRRLAAASALTAATTATAGVLAARAER